METINKLKSMKRLVLTMLLAVLLAVGLHFFKTRPAAVQHNFTVTNTDFHRVASLPLVRDDIDANIAAAISPDQAIALAVNNLVEIDGGYRLQHPRHTATFSGDGFHFRPRRGGPEWHWQLTYTSNATKPLRSIDQGTVQPVSAAYGVVCYPRGGIEEQYVMRANSIEQQFAIPQPLALGADDLVIAGKVHSNGDFETTAEGWLWRAAEGVVSLGNVTVIDAEGAEIPAKMIATATETRIEVDGAALAQAVYPVTIDPEIGTNDFRISDMGPDGNTDFGALRPAVAYNSTDNEYLVVWSGEDDTGSLVSGESEIFGQRLAGDGTEIGSNDFRISDMGPDGDADFDAEDPAVAYNSTDNEYLVVWDGDDNTGSLVKDESEIFGQRLAADGSEIGSNDFRISDMGPDGDAGFAAFFAEVAYNSTDNEYLVVWRGDDDTGSLVNGELEIFGQRINTSGSEIGSNDFRISDMGPDGDTGFGATWPGVAYNSTENEYLVVWRGDDDTGSLVKDELEIFGQRLNSGGSEIGSNDFRISDLGPDGDTGFQAWTPAVAYNSTDNEYLVVWSGDDDTGSLVDDEDEIFGQRLNSGGSEIGSNDFRISDMGPDGDVDFGTFFPAVVYNSTDNEYLVVWSGDDDTGLLVDDEAEIFGQRLNSGGSEIGSNDFRISDMGPDGTPAFSAFDPAVAYNSTDKEYLVVWAGDDVGDWEIFGQRFSRFPHNFVFLTSGQVKIDGNVTSEGDIHAGSKIEFMKGEGSPGVHKGDLTAGDDITIRKNNRIEGDAIAGDDLYLFGDAEVTGDEKDHQPVGPLPLPAFAFTAGGPDKIVPKKGALVLAPGTYSKVKVKKKGKLFLSAGNYYVDELDTDRKAELHLDVSGGQINIFVVEDIEFDDKVKMIISPGGDASSELVNIVSLQEHKIDIGKDCDIFCTLIAPEAEVHFCHGCRLRGAICAESITVEEEVPFLHHDAATPLPKRAPSSDKDDDVEVAGVATEYTLAQNYPNPFNPTTTIRFALPKAGEAKLLIYNRTGQLVRTLVARATPAGEHSVTWDATDDNGRRVASGVYMYTLKAGSYTARKKLILMK